ncbi:MAG: DinB family protein [Blastocatellia bacterium]|nr:DinB family protein [Blastocatellia bacterium]
MKQNDPLRKQLISILDWEDAHAGFAAAIDGIPPDLRGVQPEGLPYSLWQLLEHLRLCQLDILEFCRNPAYQEPASMDEYWPKTSAPPDPKAWDKSIASFLKDREDLKQLAADQIDLFDKIPHGNGQTYLRELLLVTDHNAYHIGQLIAVRRLLGCW